jgi:hypothetical protein
MTMIMKIVRGSGPDGLNFKPREERESSDDRIGPCWDHYLTVKAADGLSMDTTMNLHGSHQFGSVLLIITRTDGRVLDR